MTPIRESTFRQHLPTFGTEADEVYLRILFFPFRRKVITIKRLLSNVNTHIFVHNEDCWTRQHLLFSYQTLM